MLPDQHQSILIDIFGYRSDC